MTMSFPRQSARTRRFTLGAPRGFQVAPDGSYVTFLRTQGGTDAVTCLWRLDLATGEETLVADPRALNVDERNLPAEERARRERAREAAGGVVGYAADSTLATAVFALAGQLFHADLRAGTVKPLSAVTPVFDPRLDPRGRRVAYVADRALHVIELASGEDSVVARPESEQVSYGLAEFIAAEEMSRMRGYWWSPAGTELLVARVDETPVNRWHIADPANPDRAPYEIAYPAAGTPNAIVSLVIAAADGSRKVAVAWDRGMYPYLVTAYWDERGPLIVVQTRDQRTLRILQVDQLNGETQIVQADHDPTWLEIVPGVPARTGSGALVWTRDDSDTRRLTIAGEPVTPVGLQVRGVLGVQGESVLFAASQEPTETHVWSYGPDGLVRLTTEPGVYAAVRSGDVTVLVGSNLAEPKSKAWIHGTGQTITNLAEVPVITPAVQFLSAGEREIRTAVLLPTGWAGEGLLPVLMDPYGGPHAQRVLSVQRSYCESQWLADQGFAVVIADGRGTPGRGPVFERAVSGDFATPVLDDQIAALEAAAARFPLDLTRVAIRGWSFGGWLAALAVLRRPDVFHAAVAGAPVTDWRLYDTHYTERYLGDPGEEPEAYDANSLLADAPKLERPLMLIHGLADDNVVAAHTLRLSSALLAAGRAHTVLPLSGVTHMTPQEIVAENLLHLQVGFLRDALT
ncbi:MAG: prolyl oligopeptidase family serine peptidase [Streptosporangiaceae bacterium]